MGNQLKSIFFAASFVFVFCYELHARDKSRCGLALEGLVEQPVQQLLKQGHAALDTTPFLTKEVRAETLKQFPINKSEGQLRDRSELSKEQLLNAEHILELANELTKQLNEKLALEGKQVEINSIMIARANGQLRIPEFHRHDLPGEKQEYFVGTIGVGRPGTQTRVDGKINSTPEGHLALMAGQARLGNTKDLVEHRSHPDAKSGILILIEWSRVPQGSSPTIPTRINGMTNSYDPDSAQTQYGFALAP